MSEIISKPTPNINFNDKQVYDIVIALNTKGYEDIKYVNVEKMMHQTMLYIDMVTDAEGKTVPALHTDYAIKSKYQDFDDFNDCWEGMHENDKIDVSVTNQFLVIKAFGFNEETGEHKLEFQQWINIEDIRNITVNHINVNG